MTAPSVSAPGPGHDLVLAHGIHSAIVAAGIVGILALLLPQLHERLMGPQRARVRVPRDAHEARVMELRAEIAAGVLGTPRGWTSTPALPAPEPPLSTAERTLLPAAFVASAAAAGVHAAMAPSHLGHQALLGVGFVAAAAFQLAWAGSLVLGASRRSVSVGAVVNLALIALWAASRSVGLPGLLDQPEPVGPWDLACVAWELVVVVSCVRVLATTATPRTPATGPLAPGHRWDGRVTALAVGSAAALAALSVTGYSG